VEYAALGQDWHVRGRRQAEQVVLMNRLWTEHTVTFAGAFDRVQHAVINPLPIQQPIPIWFGGGVCAPPVVIQARSVSKPWIRSSIGGPEQWREAAERWHALGATHVTFYTSGQGIGAVPQQTEAMQRFHDAMC